MRIETIGDATLYLGDCLDIIPTLDNVDMVATSPPYGQQRDYGAKIKDWRALVSGSLTQVPDNGTTQVLVNLGITHKDGEVIPYWQGLIDDMRTSGWRHFGWYVWDQLNGMAGDWNGRLAPSFEFVFHFNRAPVSVNKIVPTKGGITHGTGLRKSSGEATKRKTHHGRETQPFKIPDSIIRTPRETMGGVLEAEHPARYPIKFATALVHPFTQPGDTVLDCFSGVATTGVACAKLGRKFIGIELDPKYFDIACKRIENAYKQPDLFIELPKKVVQEAMDL